MKKLLAFLCAVVFVFGLSGVASAVPVTGDWYLNYYWYDGVVSGDVEFGLDQFSILDPNAGWEEEIRINLNDAIYIEPLGTADTQIWNLQLISGEEVAVSFAGLAELDTLTPNAATGLLSLPDDFEVDFLAVGVIFDPVYNGGPAVPEPATMLLLGTGLMGMAVIGRKKIFRKK